MSSMYFMVVHLRFGRSSAPTNGPGRIDNILFRPLPTAPDTSALYRLCGLRLTIAPRPFTVSPSEGSPRGAHDVRGAGKRSARTRARSGGGTRHGCSRMRWEQQETDHHGAARCDHDHRAGGHVGSG